MIWKLRASAASCCPICRPVDVVVTMGCNVPMPLSALQMAGGLGLDDPTGQPDQVFTETIRRIEEKVFALKEKLR